MCYWKHHISCCFIIIITICQVVSGWKFPGVSMISLTDQIFWDRSWPVTQKTGQQLKTSQNCSKTGKLEVVPYIMVSIFEPVTISGLADRSETWPLETLQFPGVSGYRNLILSWLTGVSIPMPNWAVSLLWRLLWCFCTFPVVIGRGGQFPLPDQDLLPLVQALCPTQFLAKFSDGFL